MAGKGLDESHDPRQATAGAEAGTPPAQEQRWPGREAEMRPQADHGEDSYRGAGKLEGQVALITGADSGIGRAVAIAFAREGADVAIAYLSEDEDAETTLAWVRKAGRRGILLRADLRDRHACKRVVDETVRQLGKLDVVVNNAGFQCENDDLTQIPPDQIERTFQSNILATLRVSQAALPHLHAGASILNTGSVTALDGSAHLMDYAATKGAIHAFTKSLARNLADKGIRVNCVAPGPVWTPLIPATFEASSVEGFGGDTAWKRPAQPAEIAPSYVFLASADGRYYTGEVLGPTGRGGTR